MTIIDVSIPYQFHPKLVHSFKAREIKPPCTTFTEVYISRKWRDGLDKNKVPHVAEKKVNYCVGFGDVL